MNDGGAGGAAGAQPTGWAAFEMRVAHHPDQVRRAILAARSQRAVVGFVPTMGALHDGHRSLIRAARAACDLVAVSIFVNPTQFAPHEDLSRYPRPIDDDLRICAEEGVNLVFHPSVETIYPAGFCTFVEVEGLSNRLEGAFRPGHFRGVATVVLKLLQIVQPDVAFFGQKDFQQQLIVRRMCRDLGVPTEIRVGPTVRDPDGLALSSRNAYLSPEQRASALALSRSLRAAKALADAGERRADALRKAMRDVLAADPAVSVDYATVVDAETLEEPDLVEGRLVAVVAARVGTTRLIDNMPLDDVAP